MKKREISLDFTSLLDVVLIMLFFFILFGSLDVDEAKKAAQEAEEGYNVKAAEVEAEREQLEQEYVSLTQAEYDRLNTEFSERTQEATNKAESEKQEAQKLSEEYAKKLQELESQQQYEAKRISVLEKNDQEEASLRQEVCSFIEGTNLKLVLCMENTYGTSWYIKVKLGEVESVIPKADDLDHSILQFLTDNHYDTQSTILCELIYDGSLAGTNSAYKAIEKAVQNVSKELKSFYISTTDIS